MERPVLNPQDTVKLLLDAYLKVLCINISNDTCDEIKVKDEEIDNNKGYSPKISEWFKGFAFTGNIHSDDLAKFIEFTNLDRLNKEFSSGKDSVSLRYRRRSEDKKFHWVRMTLRKSFDYTDDNRILMLYIEDINDDVLMASEILKQHQITEKLVDMYFVCLYIDMNDNTFTRVHANSKFEKYVPESGDMNKIVDIFTNKLAIPEDNEEFIKKFSVSEIKEKLALSDSYDYEYRAKLEDGDIWCRISAVKVDSNDDGSPRHILIAMQDVTERVDSIAHTNEVLKDAFSSAVAANSAKSDFLSRMSHDIRTPLNGIIGMTAIAGANIDDHKKVADCLSKIAGAGKHLLSLINDILDLSKIESGKITLNDAEFSLPGLIDDLLTMTSSGIKSHNHKLEVNIENVEHETVIGDNVRLQQVFMNIVSNAIKYTPDGGKINIILTELPNNSANIGEYRFICEDNGIGMTPEFAAKIFEPFERSESVQNSKIQGTGLGMAIVRNIVNMMGGDIEVESELDKGSKFIVDFKIKIVNEDDITSDQLLDLPVLVVDDDEVTCESTCITLKELGMKGEYTLTGVEAVDMVVEAHKNNNDYYACLIDWKLGDIDGFETTRRIRKAVGPDVPIIIISAYEWEDIEKEALAAGADGFISKPLFKSRLKAAFTELPRSLNQKDSNEELEEFEEKDYSNKRLLLVEDNELNREIALEILKMTKAKINVAENGKVALNMFKDSEIGYFDMIFMDVRMPIMDGYEATKQIRLLDRSDATSVPIIALSANAFVEDIAESKQAGMDDHMAKPIEFDKLLKIMEKYLEDKRNIA